MKDLIGQSIGRYHIIEKLGEGGMAIVYKAYDTRLECDVAIKFIRTEKLVAENVDKTLKRFKIEAQKMAQLVHPNILPVIDFGEYEQQPYLVMRYLPGGNLKQKLGQPMAYQEAAHLLAPIAHALEYAHGQNIIHRDVKPANILITASGEPMLSDFGIAKILVNDDETRDSLTGTGVGIGTPEYMAPEQATGDDVDQRSDIYALGVVFYELVTGRKPFVADTPMAVVIKQVTEQLPRPWQFAPGLPDIVEKVIFKALAKKPEDRYQSMSEFADALEKLAFQRTTHAPVKEVEKPIAQPLKPTKHVAAEGNLNPFAAKPLLSRRRFPFWLWVVLAGIGLLGLIVVISLVVNAKADAVIKIKPSQIPAIVNPTTDAIALAATSTVILSLPPTPTAIDTPIKTPTFTSIDNLTNTPTITPTDTSTVLFQDDFSGDLSKWNIQTGTWSIQNGELAGQGGGGQIDGWIYAGDTTWQDYALQAKVIFVDYNAELVVRSTGHFQNEYRISLWQQMPGYYYSNMYQISKYQNGVTTSFTDGNIPSPVTITNPSIVRIEVKNDTIRLYINNQFVTEYTDQDPLLSGQIGLGVIWDYSNHFDDVIVTDLDINSTFTDTQANTFTPIITR
jgi:serine/threonine protein kinase